MGQLRDGISIVKIMRGKRTFGDKNDETIISVFKNGWRTERKKLVNKMGQLKVSNYEKAGGKIKDIKSIQNEMIE